MKLGPIRKPRNESENSEMSNKKCIVYQPRIYTHYNTKNGGMMTTGGMKIGLSILCFLIVGGARWTFFPFMR